MEITHRRYGDVLVITPAGRIDHAHAADFERALVPLLEPSAGSGAGIVLDFSPVAYISSVGLRVLMIASKTLRRRAARIAITGLQSIVAEIFAISRFDCVVEVFPDLRRALAAMSAAALAEHDAGGSAPPS